MSLSSLYSVFRNYVYTTLPQFVKQIAINKGNRRHPISGQLDVDAIENSYDEKPMNKSRIFEIGISLRA